MTTRTALELVDEINEIVEARHIKEHPLVDEIRSGGRRGPPSPAS